MMLKEKSSPWAKLKYLYMLPVAAVAVTAFARPEISETTEEIAGVKVNDLTAIVKTKITKTEEEVLPANTERMNTTILKDTVEPVKVMYIPSEVEEELKGTPVAVTERTTRMPEFPGGGMTAALEYIQKNMRYPESAKSKGIEGRVMVHFVVDKDGNVTDPKVLRGVDADLNAEAIRLVKSMPKWNPGMEKGQAVAVKYTLPILFNLGEEQKTNTLVVKGVDSDNLLTRTENPPLLIVDDKVVTPSIMSALDPNKIVGMTVLKNEDANNLYGAKGKNGVILIDLEGGKRSVALLNKSSVVSVPGVGAVQLANRQAEWTDVDVFVDGEKIDLDGKALDEVVSPGKIKSISVEKGVEDTDKKKSYKGKIYITTQGNRPAIAEDEIWVEGIVQDKEGEPVIGATVLIEGTSRGTVTDRDGRFVIPAEKKAKLVVSYVNMKSAKVKVAPKMTIALQDE